MTGKPTTGKSPKELLIGQDLIGFTPRHNGEGQVPGRASSAKVTVEPGWPAKSAEPKSAEPKSAEPKSAEPKSAEPKRSGDESRS